MRKKALDLMGQKFGKLTVIAKAEKSRHWVCICSCTGRENTVRADHLTSGKVQGCGCGRIKHGHTSMGRHSPTYESWKAMKGRCRDLSVPSHGGRGVKYDARWEHFEEFLKEMGERPPHTSLDRIDVTEGYYKGNCQWGSDRDQARNKRGVEFFADDFPVWGAIGTLPEWARWLARHTGKPWTAKDSARFMDLMTLGQIVNTTSPYQMTAADLQYAVRIGDARKAHEETRRMLLNTYASLGWPLTEDERRELCKLEGWDYPG